MCLAININSTRYIELCLYKRGGGGVQRNLLEPPGGGTNVELNKNYGKSKRL